MICQLAIKNKGKWVIMKTYKYDKIIKSEKGQSLVELAVSLIILLILLAGVVDLGRVAFYYLALRDAAQEGASYGSIFPNNNYEIIERTKAGIVDQSAIEEITINFPNSSYECVWPDNGDKCTIMMDSCDGNGVVEGDIIEITITDENFQLTMPFLARTITLETKIKDRVIRVPKCN